MKILFNCLSMEKGGAERVISILANNFVEKNEVTIVTLIKEKPKYDLNNEIKFINIDKISFFNVNKLRKKMCKLSLRRLCGLAKIIKKEKPDVIISFLPEPSLRLMLLKKISKKIRRIPIIVSIRNNPETEYKNKLIYFIMKKLYKNVDTLVLQTKEAKNYFKKIVKDNNRLTIIPNPINENFIMDSLYSSEREKTIVTVGRLEKQKNHRLLIDSFKEIVKKHDDYKLLLYGKGSLKTELEEYVKDINMIDKIIFKGQVDNIKQEIYNAGIFVLSSDYEGMPNALMEALAMGIPCIATDCKGGGARFLIKENENGLLVPINDVEALAKAMDKLINDRNLQKKLSANSKSKMQNYRPNIICEKWYEYIEKVVKSYE